MKFRGKKVESTDFLKKTGTCNSKYKWKGTGMFYLKAAA